MADTSAKIYKLPLKDLILNQDNPRTISKAKFAQLVESVKNFPQMLEVRPIVISEALVVLGGNMRVRACLEAGMTEAPVIMASDMTENQKREFIIKDNVGFGEWDWDAIANEWPEAPEWGLDIPEFVLNKAEASEDDYEIPDEIETDIVLGDLFEIGEHRLICGDSTKSDDVNKVLSGKEPYLMITDPPYGIDINMNMGRRRGQPKKFEDKAWDKHIPDFWYLIPKFKEQIIWGGNYYSKQLEPSKNWLCWYKKTNGLDFGEFELAWTNLDINTRMFERHWSGEQKLHPTMKPVSVMGWCLNYSEAKEIFDPFLGSGTTMVAAHQLGRKCYGIEIDPKYCQVIIDRMRKLDPSLEIKKNGVVL